ncbi:MAG: FtsK/SpoIIIE domain-containing protein [Tetrasphaera sp.]
MRLKVVLRQPGSANPETTVQVTADATATVADVAAALASGPDARTDAGATQRQLTLRVFDLAGRRALTLPPHSLVLDTGLRSGATVELAHPEHDFGRDRGPKTAMLKVVAGPDTGLDVALSSGSSTIGRGADNDVQLRDPSVSKRHARVNVTDRIEIVDANSANGLLVGGVRVSRAVLAPGDRALLGADEIAVVQLRLSASGDLQSTDFGYLRPPLVLHRPELRKLAPPDPPSPPENQRFPYLAMIAPLIMGLVLYLATKSLMSILFVALSPLLMVGSYVDQRLENRRRTKVAEAEYRAGLIRLRETIEGGHARERNQLEKLFPTVGECLAAATEIVNPLWSRRPEHPEFLGVRLGTGEIMPAVEIDLSRQPPSSAVEEYAAVASVARRLPEAPVAVDFRQVGAVGACGLRAEIAGVLRGLVLQLAVLHSPAEVVVSCLTSAAGRETWSWLDWLPHTSSPHSPLRQHLAADSAGARVLLDDLEGLVATRGTEGQGSVIRGPLQRSQDESDSAPIVPSVLVIIDDPQLDASRLVRLAEQGSDVGVFVLWVADALANLPGVCRAFLQIAPGKAGVVGLVRTERELTPVRCEAVDLATATRVARGLAPIVDGGRPTEDESDLPRSVPVVTLLGADSVDDPAQVLGRWRENHSISDRSGDPPRRRDRPADLRAVVGHAGLEPLTLDLRTQGPHALVGGTTGAGKSEFLQAWILGMAHANSPDRVSFLFVDYKGGAAFAKCIELPHCVGLVTDLSPYLVRRALRSLGAEIRYREHLLNRKGAKDLVELEKSGDPECPPSLIIIVDEFAALVGEIPEFVDGVVDVAQRGRSLGLHLVLATQRPSGVIKDNLRANTNLRVALRMADEEDSSDVLGTPLAAHFDPSIPGRGAAKTGPGRITQFQSAFPGSRTPLVPPTPPIEIVELDFGGSKPWKMRQRAEVSADLPQDIDRVVNAVVRACREGGIPDPRKPWLESLAPTYNIERMPQRHDAAIVLGILDDPDSQRQLHEYFLPDADGHILYLGAGGSGKTTALRTLALASAVTPRGGFVHVYGIDAAGGALKSLEIMPHVGSIVSGDDEERVARLMRMLVESIDERAARYRTVDASDIVEYRANADRPSEPRLLLLLDGFAAFRNAYEGYLTAGSPYMLFQRILAEGRAVGVHVAMSADRPAAVPNAISTAFQRKVILRQADEDGYTIYGLPKDVLSANSPPGRAMQVDKPQELQLAIVGQSGNMAEQVRLMREMAASVARHHRSRPAEIMSLPGHIPASTMPANVAGLPALGLSDTDLAPIGFDVTAPFVVAGPPQSGRTAALSWFAHSLRRRFPAIHLVLVSPRRSPLVSLKCWADTAQGVEETASVLERIRSVFDSQADPATCELALIIENAPEFADTSVDADLTELAARARQNGHLLIADGDVGVWGGSWGLVGELKSSKVGFMLQPDQMDGDSILKTPLPRVKRADFPPGRGFWVKAGKAVKVQLPLVD